MTRSDAHLIAGCIAGESSAWDTLVDRYRRLVYSIPLRCGLSSDDAADVFQTVFTSLLENLGRIRDPQGVAAWLITSAKRESWRTARRSRREPANSDVLGSLAEETSGEVDPQDDERWVDGLRLHEALAQIGDRCRQLLWSLYLDPQEPSYADISVRMGIPEGSIGPTRARCLQKLRTILGSMGIRKP